MRLFFGTSCIFLLSFLFFREGLYADSGFWLFRQARDGEIVEFATNAFYQWKFEPLTKSLLSGVPHGYDFLMFLFLFSGVLGSAQLMQWFLSPTEREEGKGGENAFLVLPLLVLLLFGIDSLLLASFAVFPWLLRDLLFLSSGYAPSRRIHIRFLLLSLGSVLFCGQLAMLLALLAFCLAILKGLDPQRRNFVPLMGILFLPAVFRLFLTPAPNLPLLPIGGHVVSAWGIIEHYRPMVGSDPDLLSYDWGKARGDYFLWSLLLLFVSGLSILISQRNDERSSRERISVFPQVAFTLALFLIVDTSLIPPTIAKIMPLQAFSRVVPEYVHLPLSKIFFAAGCYLLAFYWLISQSTKRRIVFSLVLFLASLVRLFPNSVVLPALQGGNSSQPLREFLSLGAVEASLGQKLFSPSYSVYRNEGFRRVQKLAERELPSEFHSMKPEEGTLHARLHPELLPRAVDGNPKTRWSAGGGKQTGKESLELEVAQQNSERFQTLRLDLGNFVSDFPRGLRVTVFSDKGEECERMDYSPWEGALLFTDAGYPYFGPQQEVLFRFIEDCKTARVLIEQTAQDRSFEWSVAEVQLPGSGK